jgi:putative glutamine amidotransferase
MKSPIIGINANLTIEARHGKPTPFARLALDYCKAITSAGGIPFIIPPSNNLSTIKVLVNSLDGLLISGAGDLNPKLYGEKLRPQTKLIDPLKQAFDLALIRKALKQKLPTLGICYGIQLINVALGGTLYQDLNKQLGPLDGIKEHKNGTHKVYINPFTRLYGILKDQQIPVNSFHHQAIKHLGKGLVYNALAEDGLIEGVESINPNRFLIGVQWHPERMADDIVQSRLFQSLVKASSIRKRK